MEYTKIAPLIGKAGELRVRSELLLRRIPAAVFDQDMGTDIILGNGKKIQVKTAVEPSLDKKAYSWRYSFSIRQSQFRSDGNGKYKKKYTKKDYKGKADYFILWCVKDNIFYIIPEKEIGKKISIAIFTPEHLRKYKRHKQYKSTSKYEKYKNNWEVLK